MVPARRIDDIKFLDRKGHTSPPGYNRHGNVVPQTLRGVRRITPGTAKLFDEVLKSP